MSAGWRGTEPRTASQKHASGKQVAGSDEQAPSPIAASASVRNVTRRILYAVADALLPTEGEIGFRVDASELAVALDALVAGLGPAHRAALAGALVAIDVAYAASLLAAPGALARASRGERRRHLAAWASAASFLRRAAFQLVRTPIVLAWAGRPEVSHAMREPAR